VYVFVSIALAASDWDVCLAVLCTSDYNYYENAAAFVFPLERTWLSMREQLLRLISQSLSAYHQIMTFFGN
jgi:hypothetical protein